MSSKGNSQQRDTNWRNNHTRSTGIGKMSTDYKRRYPHSLKRVSRYLPGGPTQNCGLEWGISPKRMMSQFTWGRRDIAADADAVRAQL